MRKVLVVIPTSARGVDLQRISGVVQNVAQGVRNVNLQPIFIIAHTPKGRRALKKKLPSNIGVNFVSVKKKGFGNALIAGINAGMRKHKPAFVMTIMSDFLRESEHAGEFLTPLVAENGVDFITGAWRNSSGLEYSRPQYLNETGASMALSLANPAVQAPPYDAKRPNAAFSKLFREGKVFQTYTGQLGFKASVWSGLQAQLKRTFSGAKESVGGWGIEPALLLCALHPELSLSVANSHFPRGAEHGLVLPKDAAQHRKSRLNQFDDSMRVIRAYLRATGQVEKIAHIDGAAALRRRRIKEASLYFNHEKAIAEKKGIEFLYR